MLSYRDKAKKAAALKYNPGEDAAPIVAAVGVGHVAENIIKKADEHGVPIVEDKQMSEILSALSVGDVIPRELYEAVAQILIFVGDYDAKYKSVLEKRL